MTSTTVISKIFLLVTAFFALSAVLWFNQKTPEVKNPVTFTAQFQTPTTTPSLSPKPLHKQKILDTNYHVFQSFNNCGPAALSMALSHYGINQSQEVLGQSLRPYQNPQGDNDDKSVTLGELAKESKKYGLIPYYRPNGNMKLIEQFIAHDIPVITRTWLSENEDIGHYRVVKGYDQSTQTVIQDDSLQGKNLSYSYDGFNAIWKKFNYEYLVLIPENKMGVAEQILEEDVNEKQSWQKAVENIENELITNPNDIYNRFNLSVALYNTKDYKRSAEEFEKVEQQLPFRTLWYQIEPIKAYYELGNYDRVFAITDAVLNTYNRAFSELYILRGKVYKKQGNIELARNEFEKAVFYNNNLSEAQEALSTLN